MTDPVEDLIDAHEALVSELFDLTPPVGIPRNPKDEKLPSRQILVVERVVHFTSGFKRDGASKPEAAHVLRLLGRPTTNTRVTSGYLQFVPQGSMRPPRYDQRHNTLSVWVDLAGMAQTLEQLRHAERYLWIGWFPGGHVFAELHSAA